jgi:hypothetical protein
VELPQGLEKRVQFTDDGKPYSAIGMLKLRLYNRTPRTFAQVPVRIQLTGGNAKLVGKILLYQGEEDSDHFIWNSQDQNDLNFTATALNLSREEAPVVTFHLFFVGDSLPDVVLSTTKDGILFKNYDESSVYWFLFGYDAVLVPALCVALLLILVVGLWQARASIFRHRCGAFIRTLEATMSRELIYGRQLTPRRVASIGGLVFKATVKRLNCTKGADVSVALALGTEADMLAANDESKVG